MKKTTRKLDVDATRPRMLTANDLREVVGGGSQRESEVLNNPLYQPSAAVAVNPLYESDGAQGTNPLYNHH